MILINFSHPLLETQLDRVKQLTGQQVDQVINVPVQFKDQGDYIHQVIRLVDEIPLSVDEWQTEAILINPPSLNFISILLLAELHGRMGFFPTHIRTRPVEDFVPPTYEVAEILDLHRVRQNARSRRIQMTEGIRDKND